MPSFWLTLASISRAEGNAEEAQRAHAEAKRVALDALTLRPNNPELLGDLAVAEAALGRKAEALQQARRAAEMLPPSSDAIAGPMGQLRLIEVLASTGDRDGALKTLGALVKQPFSPNYGDLKLNPMWDDFRDDPRFDRILAESALPPRTND